MEQWLINEVFFSHTHLFVLDDEAFSGSGRIVDRDLVSLSGHKLVLKRGSVKNSEETRHMCSLQG